MARYGGADIEALARVLEEEAPSGERDWSMDLAYFLAMALIALERLEKAGIDLSFRGKKLVEASLKKAWRDVVFIRRRRLTDEFVLNDISRPVSLSKRSGRIMIHEDQARKDRTRTTGTSNGDSHSSGGTIPNWQRRNKLGREHRFRRKKYKRPLSDSAAKLRGDTHAESD